MNAAAHERADAPPTYRRNTPLILVVEDDPQVRWYIGTALLREEGGYDVVEASNGAEALELLARMPAPPDLVITDVRMPSIDGRILGRRLAKRWPTVPVLYMSGYDSGPARGEAPLEPLVDKPVAPDAFLAVVRSLLPPG